MNAPQTKARRPQRLDFLGCGAIVRHRSEGLGVVEMVDVPPGHMPPLHVHEAHDEGFLVQEGSVSVFVPGEEIELGPGDFFLAPKGIPHTYRSGDRPAGWLVISVPGGFEGFVVDVAALAAPDPDRLSELARLHRIELLGPPGELP